MEIKIGVFIPVLVLVAVTAGMVSYAVCSLQIDAETAKLEAVIVEQEQHIQDLELRLEATEEQLEEQNEPETINTGGPED